MITTAVEPTSGAGSPGTAPTTASAVAAATAAPPSATTESRVALRLAGDAWADVLAVNRPAVAAAVAADLAAAFEVAAGAVTVHSLAAGSLVVDASVRHSRPASSDANATAAVVAGAGYGSLESAYVAQSNATLPPGGLSVLGARVQGLPFFPGATPSPDGAGREPTAGFLEECTVGCMVILVAAGTLIVVVGVGILVFALVSLKAAPPTDDDADDAKAPSATQGTTFVDVRLGGVGPDEQGAAAVLGSDMGNGGLRAHDPMLVQTLGDLFARRGQARRAAREAVAAAAAAAPPAPALRTTPTSTQRRHRRRCRAADVARANAHPEWALEPPPAPADPTCVSGRRAVVIAACSEDHAARGGTPPLRRQTAPTEADGAPGWAWSEADSFTVVVAADDDGGVVEMHDSSAGSPSSPAHRVLQRLRVSSRGDQ